MATLSRKQIENLVRQVIDTNAEELDCDEMMRVLTAYAAQLASGNAINVSGEDLVRHHLAICPECQEEFEMIKAIAKSGLLGDDV